MTYRVASYNYMEYPSLINPYVIAPEPMSVKLPLTTYTAKNMIGRRVNVGYEFTLGDYYYLNLQPKDSDTQETILIIGNSGFGKTFLARILIEIMWFNGFTPIFTISKKEPFLRMDKPNLEDKYILVKYFKEWASIYTGFSNWDQLGYGDKTHHPNYKDKGIDLKKKALEKAFKQHGFNVVNLYPPYNTSIGHQKYYINPRFLDAWSIAEAYGLDIKRRYMKLLDKAFVTIWNNPDHPNTIEEFIEELREYAEGIHDKQARLNLYTIADYIEADKNFYQKKDFKNPLYKYYLKKTIVNLTFYRVRQSMMETVIITNYIRQVIDAMQKIGSCALVFDDVGYFMKSTSIRRVLDELVNIEGRTSKAGIKKILISQKIQHFPKILKDYRTYNKIFYVKPKYGWYRYKFYQFQCQLQDNDTGEDVILFLRPPVTSGREW